MNNETENKETFESAYKKLDEIVTKMEKESLDKAAEEGVCVLESPLSGYEICGRLHAAGVPDKE